jgi:outer membrane lipopolysaccharide assembly protein LptE/RlpB
VRLQVLVLATLEEEEEEAVLFALEEEGVAAGYALVMEVEAAISRPAPEIRLPSC